MEVKSLKDLHSIGAPRHPKIVMTPTAYLTDEAWVQEVVPILVLGCHACEFNC
jgi:hypothetical protein